MPDMYLELEKDPGYPTQEVPRHRFHKHPDASPWAGAVEAVILLEDHAWVLIGQPQRLKVTLEAG